uniref:Trypsin inhibitor 1 n=1 Tax=Beta vulgaris subsp. vulgaris TaxID=3555 RepID=ITR1_BETVV|nr:RecName: Full=Trypsin inhibitor 1; AltName: Full=BevuTI-I; AltName: Full=Trypsin inhibitor I [Beta vulgaris subsp. vulgaris]
CTPSGTICSPEAPEQCCSNSCVPHQWLRIFVCA